MKYTKSKEILQKFIGINEIEYFVSRLDSDRDIGLFGFGRDGEEIYECMCKRGMNVSCICDNNWRNIQDLKVVSIESAVKNNLNAMFVVASHLHSYDMELQLLTLGVAEDRIVSFDSSVEMAYRGMLPKSAYPEMVSAMHYEVTGVYPNLDSPRTFNEKMMTAMIASPSADIIELADKFKVRRWVAGKIGEKYLIPLIGDWKKVEDIPWQKLPNKYAIKLNHGCAFNIISDGRNDVDIGVAQRKLKKWMRCNYGYMAYERQYIPIKAHIICEQYIENLDGDVYDYKIFCFHGEPKYIMLLSQRKKGLRMIFLDLEWNVLPFVYSHPKGDEVPPKPKRLEEMIEITKILCKDFDHVRVDWYVLNDSSIKFGEMTFTSCAGHAAWNPPEWDLRLGDMW